MYNTNLSNPNNMYTENKRYIPIFKKIRKYATQIHMFQMLYKHLSPVGNETQLF